MFSIFIPTASPAAIPIKVPSGPAAEPATVVPVFTASFVLSFVTFWDVFFAMFFDAFLAVLFADFLASSLPLADVFLLILLPVPSFFSFDVLIFFRIRLPSLIAPFTGLIAMPVTSSDSSMFSLPSTFSVITDSAILPTDVALLFALVAVDLLSIFASFFL